KETDEKRAQRVLRRRIAEVLQGDAIPRESRVTLDDLCNMLTADYEINHRRSLKTIPYPLRHLRDFFGDGAKAVTISTDQLQRYIRQRQDEGARARPSTSSSRYWGRLSPSRSGHDDSARSRTFPSSRAT